MRIADKSGRMPTLKRGLDNHVLVVDIARQPLKLSNPTVPSVQDYMEFKSYSR